MLWWDWTIRQRLSLLAAMIAVAASPGLLLGLLPNDVGGFVSGTAILVIPQIIAWNLFVGLRTGRMPSGHGTFEVRAEAPVWFWLTAAPYAGCLLLFLWLVLAVALAGTAGGF